MAAKDPWKRYFDIGLEFTDVTRKRAEAAVKELVKAGEVQRDHAQQRVEDLLERSRVASATLAAAVTKEVTRQLTDLGLVSAAKPAATTAKKAATSSAKKTASTANTTAATAKKAAPTAKTTAATAQKPASTAKQSTATAKKATAKTAKKTTGRS